MPDPHDSAAAARLRAAADRFVNRVGDWTPERWALSAGLARQAPAQTRADRAYALVQTLADLCADVEAGRRRPVPRLDNDLALVDQVRVMVGDLLQAGAPAAVLDAATQALVTVDLG